jgi:hypothetical protein
VSHDLTIEEFKSALPDKLKKSLNQELIDQINQTLSDPDMYEQYRENMLSYTKVMQDGRFKVSNYIEAVKYVSHKLMGCSNIEAYSKTFPGKLAAWSANGVTPKDQASYITAYNKGKLVNLIFEQTMVPIYVLNQDKVQSAINVLAELMVSATSEKVRSDSATSLLTHLKVPETTKVQLDIGVKEDGSIAALRQATLALAESQRLAIASGAMSAQQVAHSKIIEGTAERVQ